MPPLLWLAFCATFWIVSSEFVPLYQERRPPWQSFRSTKTEVDCTEEGKSRAFPHLYQVNDTSGELGAPENLTSTHVDREAINFGGQKDVLYPGILITFSKTEIGSENLRGYELNLHKNGGSMCFVFDFTGLQRGQVDKVEIELFPLSGLTRHRLSVWSLPKYNGSLATEQQTVITGVFGSYKPDARDAPAEWFARIKYEILIDEVTGNRSVEVVHSRPPPEYNFQRFEVTLVPDHEDSVLVIHVATTTVFYHVFTDVVPGNYTVMVRPVDDYFSLSEHCLCHVTSGACSTCLSTQTEMFAIE